MNNECQILQLNVAGQPQQWITQERAANLYFTDKIAWGWSDSIVLSGGVNRITGVRSTLEMRAIVAVKGKVFNHQSNVIHLSNHALFSRDGHICAYCGDKFKHDELTRDHVVPTSRGGLNTWTNVVSACWSCNQRKDNKMVGGKIKLLYIPYRPCRSQMLILANRRILADQQEFLLSKVKHKQLLN